MKKNLLFTLFLLLVVATAFAQRQFRFKDGKFKVVQFTDIHWDPKSPGCDTTRNTILSVLKQEKPDIAILTGDVVTDNPARKGWESEDIRGRKDAVRSHYGQPRRRAAIYEQAGHL